jgi:hypothetical protein
MHAVSMCCELGMAACMLATLRGANVTTGHSGFGGKHVTWSTYLFLAASLAVTVLSFIGSVVGAHALFQAAGRWLRRAVRECAERGLRRVATFAAAARARARIAPSAYRDEVRDVQDKDGSTLGPSCCASTELACEADAQGAVGHGVGGLAACVTGEDIGTQ